MKILTIDIGTGTQDIFLFDPRLSVENGFKLVVPSPTMIVHRRIREATRRGEALLLAGRLMGGGPSTWAAKAHARAGLPIFATPDAARTFDDDLGRVEAMGIQVVPEEEARRLPRAVCRLHLCDLDLPAIRAAFESFGVSLDGLSAVAVAVFDHGDAPPGVSDRLFRFEALDACLRRRNSLTSFAHLAGEIPPAMTRLQAVADSAEGLDCPLVLMDTAPAAVLGAAFDPVVRGRRRRLIANLGNFHALAFRMDGDRVEGLFEHHTGEIDLPRLEGYLRLLADGTLSNEQVFQEMGHGALVLASQPLLLGEGEWDVAVTGPRRGMFQPPARPTLRPHFAVPFGDMMLAGNIGLLAAAADLLPGLGEEIHASLANGSAGAAPWDA